MSALFPLPRRVRVAGVVDMVFSTIGIVTTAQDIFKSFELTTSSTNEQIVENARAERSLTSLYFALLLALLKFSLGFRVFKAASTQNVPSCRQWLYVNGILWCHQTMKFVTDIASGAFGIFSTIIALLPIVIRVFVMSNVYRFINSIKQE